MHRSTALAKKSAHGSHHNIAAHAACVWSEEAINPPGGSGLNSKGTRITLCSDALVLTFINVTAHGRCRADVHKAEVRNNMPEYKAVTLCSLSDLVPQYVTMRQLDEAAIWILH
jgi:hypothetical protein